MDFFYCFKINFLFFKMYVYYWYYLMYKYFQIHIIVLFGPGFWYCGEHLNKHINNIMLYTNSYFMYQIITFYIYAFSRRFYPKRLTFHYIYI